MDDFSALRPLHTLKPNNRPSGTLSPRFLRDDPLSQQIATLSAVVSTSSPLEEHHGRGPIAGVPGDAASGSRMMDEQGKGEQARFLIHKVSRFDTLAGLAIKYGVQVEQLKRVNRLTSDMQLFALGEVRIPLLGDGPSPQASPAPTPSPKRTRPLSSSAQEARSGGKGNTPTSTGKSTGGTAAAVAAGREAAAASVQLVESIDPELLLGVKGLRSAAETGSPGAAGNPAASKGANTVALLLALQQRSSRTSTLGMGIGVEADPLAHLTLSSSSSELLEETDSSSGWDVGPEWIQGMLRDGRLGPLFSTQSASADQRGVRRSLPPGVRQDRGSWGLQPGSQQRRSEQLASGSFWEHEFKGEEGQHPVTLASFKPGNQREGSGEGLHTATMLPMDSTAATLVGLTGEQLTMRRRGGGTAAGRPSRYGEEGSGLSSGEEQEGAGWVSADEFVSGRLEGARGGTLVSTQSNSSNNIAGKSGRGRGEGARAKQGSALPRPGMSSLYPGNGSTYYESVEGVNGSKAVGGAAIWGTRVIDDLWGQLRRSGGWFLERSAQPGAGEGTGASGTDGRGDMGIDLPVLNRGFGATTGAGHAVGPSGTSATSSDKDVSWASSTASATVRRSSKGKAALD